MLVRRLVFSFALLAALPAAAQSPPALAVSVSPASANEGAKFRVTISRSGDLSSVTRVTWSVGGDIDGADFGVAAPPSGTSGFSPGQTTKVITLQSVDDTFDEPDEALTVTLSSPSNAVIGTGVATATIVNNDASTPPPPPPAGKSPLTLINPGHSAYWAIEDAFINHINVTGEAHNTWIKYGLLDPVTATFVRGATSGSLLIGVVRSGAGVRASGAYYKGKWILDWEGDGDFTFAGGVGSTVRVSPNRIEETFDPTVHGYRTLKINLTRVGAAGVRNIRFYRAEHEPLLASGKIFDPEWLKDVSRFDVIRPMDWSGVNDDNEITVADRPRPNWPFYMPGRVPDRVIVRAAVESGTQLWLNIPGLLGASPQLSAILHDASLDRTTRANAAANAFDAIMADPAPLDWARVIVGELEAQGYPVTRPLFFEIDNEVWNTVFFASTDFYAGIGQAVAARHSGQAGNARTGYGYRSAQFADAIAQALAEKGRAAQPWTMVLAGQTVNIKRTTDALAAVIAYNGGQPMCRYGVSTTNYFNGGFFWHGDNLLFGSKMSQDAWQKRWLADFAADPAALAQRIHDYVYSPTPMYSNLASYAANALIHKQTADAAGARWIGNYEGDSNEKMDAVLSANAAAVRFHQQWHESDENGQAILAVADTIRQLDPNAIMANYIFCAAPRKPLSPWVECTPWDRTSGADNAAWDLLLKPRN